MLLLISTPGQILVIYLHAYHRNAEANQILLPVDTRQTRKLVYARRSTTPSGRLVAYHGLGERAEQKVTRLKLAAVLTQLAGWLTLVSDGRHAANFGSPADSRWLPAAMSRAVQVSAVPGASRGSTMALTISGLPIDDQFAFMGVSSRKKKAAELQSVRRQACLTANLV